MLYYQIFIEPKGDQFKGIGSVFSTGKEAWKLKFLEEITTKYGATNLLKHETNEYSLIGLPFYNKKTESTFKSSIKKKINIK